MNKSEVGIYLLYNIVSDFHNMNSLKTGGSLLLMKICLLTLKINVKPYSVTFNVVV